MIQIGETGKVADALYVRADATFRRTVISEAKKAAAPMGSEVDLDCVYQHQRQMVKIAFMRDSSRSMIPYDRLATSVALELAKGGENDGNSDPVLRLPQVAVQ